MNTDSKIRVLVLINILIIRLKTSGLKIRQETASGQTDVFVFLIFPSIRQELLILFKTLSDNDCQHLRKTMKKKDFKTA